MFCWTAYLNGGPREPEGIEGPGKPEGIGGPGYAAVAVEHKVYYFGGFCDDYVVQAKVHVFNTVTFRWMNLPPATPVRGYLKFHSMGHTAVLIEDTVYVWGGSPHYNVFYAFDVDAHSWFQPRVSGTIPVGRRGHSACVLGKVMYIYGGAKFYLNYISFKTGIPHDDIYKLDTSTMVWSLINTRGTAPPGSYDHSATIIGTKMFVFGRLWDKDELVSQDNIRVFDTETNCWMNTPSTQLLPERRWRHSSFTYNGDLYIFGGRGRNRYFKDLWKFSPETFSWKKIESKGKGQCPMRGMCCCMVGDRILLFGGFKNRVNTPDYLYILDLSPSLKTLCKLAVILYGLKRSELPHNIRWELAAMNRPTKCKRHRDF